MGKLADRLLGLVAPKATAAAGCSVTTWCQECPAPRIYLSQKVTRVLPQRRLLQQLWQLRRLLTVPITAGHPILGCPAACPGSRTGDLPWPPLPQPSLPSPR